MPKFTLVKHPDNQFDAEVTVTFESDMLGVARGHFDDFLKASGFELPLEVEEPNEEPDFVHGSGTRHPSRPLSIL